MIYLDNNATTRVAPQVLEAMLPHLTGEYGNPSSPHRLGMSAKAALQRARLQVAKSVGANASELVFTGSCTEANQTALRGALDARPGRKRIVTTAVEHASILSALETRGADVVRVPVRSSGELDLERLREAVDADTALVSIMWANNETGVLYPVETAAAIAHEQGALFHTDATQALGRVPVGLAAAGVDLASFSAHKVHGPKGIGALFVRTGVGLTPLIVGSQERRRRGGTENVPGIVAFGCACALAVARLAEESARLQQLRDELERELPAVCPGVRINGQDARRLPNTTSATFPGLAAEALLDRLDRAGVAASAGSACNAGGNHPSHVLLAMGLSPREAHATIRFSFGRFNEREDVPRAVQVLREAIAGLHALAEA